MKRIIAAALGASCLLANKAQVIAQPHYETGVLYQIECTAYCDTGDTSTGYTIPADGSMKKQIAAFSPEMAGYVAVVTMPDGTNQMYEILDTGSIECGIRTGEFMDLWMPTEHQCNEFGRQVLNVYFVKGEG